MRPKRGTLTEGQQKVLQACFDLLTETGLRQRPREIAERANVHAGNISTKLWSLEHQGLIEQADERKGRDYGKCVVAAWLLDGRSVRATHEIAYDDAFDVYRFKSDLKQLQSSRAPRARSCLRCSATFEAIGRFNFMCGYCARDAGNDLPLDVLGIGYRTNVQAMLTRSRAGFPLPLTAVLAANKKRLRQDRRARCATESRVPLPLPPNDDAAVKE